MMVPCYCHNLNENNDMEIMEQPYADAFAENINEYANESSFDIYDEDNSMEDLEQTFSDTSSESMDESDRELPSEEHITIVIESPDDSDSEIPYYCIFYDGEGGSIVVPQAQHINSDESDEYDNEDIAEPPENVYDVHRRESFYRALYGYAENNVALQQEHNYSDESDDVDEE